MRKIIWAILLAQALGVLVTGIVYSQEGEPYKEKIQSVVKKFSGMAAEQILTDWEKINKQKAEPTIDVSGSWCVTKISVSSEEEKKENQKIIIELQQDREGKVSGRVQSFWLHNEENQWKAGRRFLIEGKVNKNTLTGNSLDEKGKTLYKTMFTFKGDNLEGLLISTTESPDIIEIGAVRCSVR